MNVMPGSAIPRSRTVRRYGGIRLNPAGTVWRLSRGKGCFCIRVREKFCFSSLFFSPREGERVEVVVRHKERGEWEGKYILLTGFVYDRYMYPGHNRQPRPHPHVGADPNRPLRPPRSLRGQPITRHPARRPGILLPTGPRLECSAAKRW